MGCGGSKAAGVNPKPQHNEPSKAEPKPGHEAATQQKTQVTPIPLKPQPAEPLLEESLAVTPGDPQLNSVAAKAFASGKAQLPTANKPSAADTEFDYESDLKSSSNRRLSKPNSVTPATGPVGQASHGYAANGANSGAFIGLPVQAGVVGGLLSKQPDWLADSGKHNAAVAPTDIYSSSQGKTYLGVSQHAAASSDSIASPVQSTVYDTSFYSTHATNAQEDAGQHAAAYSTSTAAAGSALPPTAKGPHAIAGSSSHSSLPPIRPQGKVLDSLAAGPAAPAAAAAQAASVPDLPAPRRLTGSIQGVKTDDRPLAKPELPGAGGGSSCISVTDDLPEQQEQLDTSKTTGAHEAAAEGHAHAASSDNEQQLGRQASIVSGTGRNSSPPPAAAGDPWSALQSQYAVAKGQCSDNVQSGAHNSHHQHIQHSSAHAAGSEHHRSATGAAAAASGTSRRSSVVDSELVLESSDDEHGDSGVAINVGAKKSSTERQDIHYWRVSASPGQSSREEQQQHKYAGTADWDSDAVARVGPRQHNSSGTLTAEGSKAAEVGHKSGGWGAGNMAAAGTLMLGQENQQQRQAAEGYAADDDDVFGNSGRGGVVPESSAVPAAAQRHYNRSNSASNSANQPLQQQHSHAALGGGGGAINAIIREVSQSRMQAAGFDDVLGIEEIDDVDAMIEAELAAKNALPGDLAAKLAQFEAMADDEDE
eukprot:GHRR01018824.1.p1 GENE.GHRR01018824.1~~GHRR01018824.1.p1  ORF type:complete len:706 (+),score=312.84 GHRR01018824.1:339-2456(+)